MASVDYKKIDRECVVLRRGCGTFSIQWVSSVEDLTGSVLVKLTSTIAIINFPLPFSALMHSFIHCTFRKLRIMAMV